MNNELEKRAHVYSINQMELRISNKVPITILESASSITSTTWNWEKRWTSRKLKLMSLSSLLIATMSMSTPDFRLIKDVCWECSYFKCKYFKRSDLQDDNPLKDLKQIYPLFQINIFLTKFDVLLIFCFCFRWCDIDRSRWPISLSAWHESPCSWSRCRRWFRVWPWQEQRQEWWPQFKREFRRPGKNISNQGALR